MALKTKKAKVSFRSRVTSILEAHGFHLEAETLDPLLKDLMDFTVNFDDTTEFWQEIRANWCDVFRVVTGRECAFIGGEHKALKEISKELKKRYLDKNPENVWTAQTAVSTHNAYYTTVLKLPYVEKNFSSSYLYYHFDQNISMIADIQKKKRENS